MVDSFMIINPNVVCFCKMEHQNRQSKENKKNWQKYYKIGLNCVDAAERQWWATKLLESPFSELFGRNF